MAYSLDFRKKVLYVREKEKLSMEEVSIRFCIGKASVMRWSKCVGYRSKRHKPATKIDMDSLKKDIENYSDAYNYERSARLGVSTSGIWYALKRLGVTYKKNPKSSKSQRRREIFISDKNADL